MVGCYNNGYSNSENITKIIGPYQTNSLYFRFRSSDYNDGSDRNDYPAGVYGGAKINSITCL